MPYLHAASRAALLALSCLISTFLYSQPALSYFPFYTKDTLPLFTLSKTCSESVEASYTLEEEVGKAYRKHYKQIKRNNTAEVRSLVRYGAMVDTAIEPYLQSVFGHIIEGNPQFSSCHLVLSKSPVANAYAFGDGTIVFNMGLLARLENESQLAFILCHELAHGYFNHIQQGLKSRLSVIYSDSVQKQLNNIIKEEYNINSKINSLVLGISLNGMYHQRSQEKEADSLAYYLMLNTGYDASQAVTALALLKNIEDPVSSAIIAYDSFFNCNVHQYNFKNVPEKKKSIFEVKPKEKTALELSDSLKTHPDCAKRMAFIREMMGDRPLPPARATDINRFQTIARYATYETIQSWFDYEYYDRSLYEALLQLSTDPHNEYLHAVIILSLFKLHSYMTAHEYAQVVSNISAHNAANFNDLIKMLNNLKLANLEDFSYCFMSRYTSNEEDSEFMLAASYAAAKMQNNIKAADMYKDSYKTSFSPGRFDSLMQLNLKKKK